MAQNICRNCKWAEWMMTNHNPPRVNKKQYGGCAYPMNRVAVPVCAIRSLTTENDKSKIWWHYDMPCRVWENKNT